MDQQNNRKKRDEALAAVKELADAYGHRVRGDSCHIIQLHLKIKDHLDELSGRAYKEVSEVVHKLFAAKR